MRLMKKWFFRILWIPVLVVAVLFLFANRQMVAISLDPFYAAAPSVTTIAMPLWFWLMSMMFLGLGAGSFGMWLSGRPRRQKARAERRELKALKQEASDLRARLNAAEGTKTEPSSDLPLIESTNI